MDRTISAARSVEKIVSDIMLELGGVRGEDLRLSKEATAMWVTAHVECLGRAERNPRERRRAEADYAEKLDGQMVELETSLTHPLAPTPDAGLLAGIERMRAACR
jgi:hypothetical protein